MNCTRRHLALALSMASVLACAPFVAQAQTVYPSKPIKLIVPFPPGGNVDLSARILVPELAKELGQPLVVDNKAGAGGTLGLVLPGKPPAELITKLNQALNKVLSKPHVQEQFARLGADVRPGSPEAYASFIRSEIARTAKIVRDAHITLN